MIFGPTCSFLLLFSDIQVWFYFEDNALLINIIFSLLAVLFNIGWSACWVAHLSLGPALTCSRTRRD